MIRSINNTKPSFRGVGVSDALVKTFESLARGGKAAEFISQDLMSCGLPRTVSSLNRNKEKTGHLNYIAGAETGLREGLTGSSTFTVPMAVLAIARVLTGKANDVPIHSIRDLSDIMAKGKVIQNAKVGQFTKEAAKTARRDFYIDTFKQVGENMKLENVEEFATEFAEKVMMYETRPKRNFIARMFKNGNGQFKDEHLEKLINDFVKYRKSNTDDWSCDLLSAKLSEGNEVKIDKLVKYMKDFADEFVDKGKCLKDINTFKTTRMGSRFITVIARVVATALVMMVLPKLYKLSKTNPEAEIDQPQGGQK